MDFGVSYLNWIWNTKKIRVLCQIKQAVVIKERHRCFATRVIADTHLESCSSRRNFLPDASHSENAQSLSRNFDTKRKRMT